MGGCVDFYLSILLPNNENEALKECRKHKFSP